MKLIKEPQKPIRFVFCVCGTLNGAGNRGGSCTAVCSGNCNMVCNSHCGSVGGGEAPHN